MLTIEDFWQHCNFMLQTWLVWIYQMVVNTLKLVPVLLLYCTYIHVHMYIVQV